MGSTKLVQTIRSGSRNKQEINIIVDALRNSRKKRKARKQAPPPEPLPTLETLAQSVRPAMYPPTQVISVNPAGLPTPTMFDVTKQNQLNSILNKQDVLRQQIEDMQMNMQPMIEKYIEAGMPQRAQSVAQSLSGLTDILMRDPNAMSEADIDALSRSIESWTSSDPLGSLAARANMEPPDAFSDTSSVYQFREPYQADERQTITNPIFDPIEMADVETQTFGPTMVESGQQAVPRMAEAYAATDSMSPLENVGKPVDEPTTSAGSNDEEDEEDEIEEGPVTPLKKDDKKDIKDAINIVKNSLDRHPQRNKQEVKFQDTWKYLQAEYVSPEAWRNRNAKSKAAYKKKLTAFVDDYLENVIMTDSAKAAAREKMDRLFASRSQIGTRIKLIDQLVSKK